MTIYKIAVIPGDGIGLEVVAAGLQVLNAAADRFGFSETELRGLARNGFRYAFGGP